MDGTLAKGGAACLCYQGDTLYAYLYSVLMT